MKSLPVAALVVIAVLGCSNKDAEENARKAALYDAAQAQLEQLKKEKSKQEKLEKCFSDASDRYHHVIDKSKCTSENPPSPGACLEVFALMKQERKDAEDSCVKLYK